MSKSFIDLGLSRDVIAGLAREGFSEPFPIQAEAIPPALAGSDILGKAPTGSGKTLAFGLPVLSRVTKAKAHRPTALMLAPTRELADQIKSDLAPIATAARRRVDAIYGGVGYGGQIKALRRGVDILVATPGRLEDLIDQRHVNLGSVEIVVIDEADRMADMGFIPAVRRLLDQVPHKAQTLLFSATLDGDVSTLSRKYQSHPVNIEAESISQEEPVEAEHYFFKVKRETRVTTTADVVTSQGRSIVFTRTRRGADRLAKQLERNGVAAVAMHGGRSQAQRARALKSFSSGRTPALVATDVAARGIHVDDVACVIHYDLAGDAKDYTHRSGRTARAGAAGTVVTMVLPDQQRQARRLLRDLDISVSTDMPRTPTESQPSRPSSERPAGRPSPDKGNPTQRSIFVGNLPWKASESDLEELFAGHGPVGGAMIAKQRPGGRSKGYGFVEMSERDSSAAIKALNGATLDGRRLQIRYART